MKRNIYRHMSREEVIASMANKLAEGASSAKKHNNKRFALICFAAGGILCFLILFSFLGKSRKEEKQTAYLKTASVMQSPLLKMKTAYNEEVIGADEYALYLNYLLVRYDSVPEKFRTPRPIINGEEVSAEIQKIWGRLSIQMRERMMQDLPDYKYGKKTE